MRTFATLTLALLFAVPVLAGEPAVLVDFETGEPAEGWHTSGLTLSETTADAEKTVSGGRALALIGEDDKKTRVGYIFRAVDVQDWREFRAFSLHAKVEADDPIEMRIIAWDGRGRRGMLRRFKLFPGDWREVVLPLSKWREEVWDYVGDFGRVTGMELRWDEGSGTVTIDDLRLLPGKKENLSCRPTIEERIAIAFPEGKTKIHETPHFQLVTNATRFKGKEGKKVAARLEEVPALLEKRWDLSGKADVPVPFIVFKKAEQYREFFVFLGKAFGATVHPPTTDGYSVLGVVGSTWSAEYGWKRPVYVHEAAHGIVRQRLGLASNGNWIQEGLANAVQVNFYPDSWSVFELKKKFAAREAGKEPWLPWGKLLMEKRPGMAYYDQLATMMEFLAERYRDDLPKFWDLLRGSEEMVHKNSAELLSSALGKTISELEAEWIEWGKNKYYGK
ncbi:MAG: hypothetical protein ABFS86_10065 [Planctomycetota bacterium]